MKNIIQEALKILNVVDSSTNNKILTKGITSLDYSGNVFINKNGKEIKEKLLVLKEEEKLNMQKILDEMVSLKNQISIQPKEDPVYYLYEDLNLKIEILPKVYSWRLLDETSSQEEKSSEIYNLTSARSSFLTPEIEKPLSKGEILLARKYNLTVEKYFASLKELKYIQTLLNNLKDNQIYNLTVKQATSLNF